MRLLKIFDKLQYAGGLDLIKLKWPDMRKIQSAS